MGHGQDDNAEQADDDANDPKNEINNEISGGQFDGPVGQFGKVYGDVNMNYPPKSPEEAAFRARYMAKMQDKWDAEDEGPDGCAKVWVTFAVVFVLFWIIVAIYMFSTRGLHP